MAGETHGWNRPSPGVKGRGDKGPPIWRGAMAGAVVVAALAAVVGYLFFTAGSGSPPEPTGRRPSGKVQEPPRKPPKPKAAKDGKAAEKSLAMPKPSGKYIEKRDEVAAPQPLEELQSAMTNAPAETAKAITKRAKKPRMPAMPKPTICVRECLRALRLRTLMVPFPSF